MICSIKASVEMLSILPDEHVFGPGQNSCSIPNDSAPTPALENVATAGINTIVPMEV